MGRKPLIFLMKNAYTFLLNHIFLEPNLVVYYPMDDHHFNYITKMKKKNLPIKGCVLMIQMKHHYIFGASLAY
jgi:hypothetical protein